jgi:hypothetical protein
MGQQIQTLGFYLAGFLCLVLAVLKLTIEVHWSWWRVLSPLWLVLGHNALDVAVGFVWLFSPTTAQQEKKSRSAKTIARTVNNWRRYCVSSFSCITC